MQKSTCGSLQICAMLSASSSPHAVAEGSPAYGQIQQAMAYRVKYRIQHKEGTKTVNTILINIRSLGVHMKNRGGVYPNKDTLKGLCSFLIQKGFTRAEADHQGVCVQNVPATELSQTVEDIGAYNRAKTQDTPELTSLFDSRTLQAGTLSHSHLLLVLLAWLIGAKWDLPNDEGAVISRTCDDQGRLDMAAVAEHLNAREMMDVINEGIRMEVLSWKIYVEEPGKCAMISNALNKSHEIVLRTTELSALESLTGELSLQMNASAAQAVKFDSVREALRSQLDDYVDEPDFLEMFEFVINLGGSKHSFVSGFSRG